MPAGEFSRRLQGCKNCQWDAYMHVHMYMHTCVSLSIQLHFANSMMDYSRQLKKRTIRGQWGKKRTKKETTFLKVYEELI